MSPELMRELCDLERDAISRRGLEIPFILTEYAPNITDAVEAAGTIKLALVFDRGPDSDWKRRAKAAIAEYERWRSGEH